LLCNLKRKKNNEEESIFLPLIPAFSPEGEKELRAKALFYRANSYRKYLCRYLCFWGEG